MENLHLKNLKKDDVVDNNLKQIHELNIQLNKLTTITLDYLIHELKQMNIKDLKINELKNRYLQNIIKNKYKLATENNLNKIQEFINEINKLKEITLNSKINPQNYELHFRKYNRYAKNIEIEIINCTLLKESNHQKTYLTLLLTYNKLNNNIEKIEIEETYYK